MFALRLTACGADGDGGGSLPTTSTGGQSSAATGGTGGKTGSSTGGGPSTAGSSASGSAGSSVSNGVGGSSAGGGTTQGVPDIFYEGWYYDTATLYEAGEDPIVVGVDGDAHFERDNTYVQSYYIGKVLNYYEGTYTIQGDKLQTFDEKGEPAFTYTFTVSDELKELVLTIENEDGSPSIIYGLSSMKK